MTREQTQRIWNARGGVIRACQQIISNIEETYDTPARISDKFVPLVLDNLHEAVKELTAAEECIPE